MPIQNTRDRIARDCVIASLQLFMSKDQHPALEIDGVTVEQFSLRAMLRSFSTSESIASAVRAIDSLPYTLRIHQFCNAAHSHPHLDGVEHQLRRLLNEDRAGFEQALEEQWKVAREECVAKLQETKYPFEPATNIPKPREM